jgi:hypothetical protein
LLRSNFKFSCILVGLCGSKVDRMRHHKWADLSVRCGLSNRPNDGCAAGDNTSPSQLRPGFRCLPALGWLFQRQGTLGGSLSSCCVPSSALAFWCAPAVGHGAAAKVVSLLASGQSGVPRDFSRSGAMASWPRGRGFAPHTGRETGRWLQGAG